MRRALVLPVSAAVLGALLAIGVSALDRARDAAPARVHVVRSVESVDMAEVERELAAAEAEIAEAMEGLARIEVDVADGFDRTLLREIREQVRSELRSAMEAEELTEAERARVKEAMAQLEAQLPMMAGLADLVDGITREDGSAHPRSSGN